VQLKNIQDLMGNIQGKRPPGGIRGRTEENNTKIDLEK
jgi:hypothetical protein